MAVPNTREGLKTWCLTQIGHPVIDINVDDSQIENAIDEALQYFQEFHHDGVERTFLKHLITTDDITNKYITVSDQIVGVSKIFPVSSAKTSTNMFDVRYQLRLNDLFDFTSVSYTNYVMTMQHIRTLELLFTGDTPIRFNKHTNKLYIDWRWETDVQPGEYILGEAYVITDPETYTDVYNDRLLKKLATAYLKKMWGYNMKKFSGAVLPGGITMNGQVYYEEAVAECKEIEDLIRSSHQEPPEMIIG